MDITKEMLANIEQIELVLENCEVFSFQSEDVIDINFDVEQSGAGKHAENVSHDGRLVISKNAFQRLSNFGMEEWEHGEATVDDNSVEDYWFCNRITMWCDVVQIDILFKNGYKLWFYVKYDPLESELLVRELEYSNCPSSEIDENGNMLLLFGNSSRNFKRVDNDFFNLIEGLSELFPQRNKDALSLQVETIGNGGYDCLNPDGGMYAEVRVKNKIFKSKCIPLQFFDVTEALFYFDYVNGFAQELSVSTTSDGRIFVQVGATCNFYCKKIKVMESFE